MKDILKDQKNNCQVFTPDNIVATMLDILDYKSNVYNKSILENSCGDGQFLKEIVKRYIKDGLNRNISEKNIKSGLQRDIVGVEIDRTELEKCRSNLTTVAESYGIFGVEWKLVNMDALKFESQKKFDFIVGNPPYISYAALTEHTREFLKLNFSSCKMGKPDYYYAFIESALGHLNENGELVYLVPNNFYKNRFAEVLRENVLENLFSLYDFTHQQLFEDRMTSSVIIHCKKNLISETLKYNDVTNRETILFKKNSLKNKWTFKALDSYEDTHKFGDYFNVSHGVATQLNRVFILKNYKIKDSDIIHFSGNTVELNCTYPAASPKSMFYNKEEKIIFPYEYTKSGFKKIEEERFKREYPLAYNYFEKNKDDLESRKKDKSALWFHFGRSQALSHIYQEKLLMSTIITDKVNVWELDKFTVPYSGVYITSKGSCSLKIAKKILESEHFLSYIKAMGICSNGKSFRISSKDIMSYRFKNQYLQAEVNNE